MGLHGVGVGVARLCSSADIFLDEDERTFFSLHEDKVVEETTALLKKRSQDDTGHSYKLGKEKLEPDL